MASAPTDECPGLVALFDQQSRLSAEVGSPLYAAICAAIGQDVAQDGASATLLADFAGARTGEMVPLRLLGVLHRRVLTGAEPSLAAFFPSVGGSVPAPDDAAGWEELRRRVVAAVGANVATLRPLLDQIPQTNEAGRAACLLGVLTLAANAWSLPIRLHEIGCSAGLNLRADQFRVTGADGAGLGPLDSPLRLPDAWRGPAPLAHTDVNVIERIGVDLNPLDATTAEGKLRLTSFIWADQTGRFARLNAALELAERFPATLIQSNAADYVESLSLQSGTTLLIWHSAFWMYLSERDRNRIDDHLETLGKLADASSPLVHLSLEARDPDPAAPYRGWIVVRAWPALPTTDMARGAPVRLGVAAPHGIPMVWETPTDL